SLFLDDAFIQLLEQRTRLSQRLIGFELARLPCWSRIICRAITQHSMYAKRVLYFFDVLFTKEWSIVTQESIQLLRRKWQERSKEHLKRIDGAHGGVDRL